MRLLNVLTWSVESCLLAGKRKYIVGAKAAMVASAPVAKRSSGELYLRIDILTVKSYPLMQFRSVDTLEDVIKKHRQSC